MRANKAEILKLKFPRNLPKLYYQRIIIYKSRLGEHKTTERDFSEL